LVKPGAMRSLASIVAREAPHVLAVCDIDPGDALSLATRFALEWAYRGRQALFWRAEFSVREVRDLYLPVRVDRPFERRGFVCVDASHAARDCTLVTTQFDVERAARIPELRFARTFLRRVARDAVLCAYLRERAIAFEDLGFRDATPQGPRSERVYVRGFDGYDVTAVTSTV
jgi:hypothetical protein